MTDDLEGLFPGRAGHFRLESGHHGELWLELPALFLRPERVAPHVAALAARLARHEVTVICGPLVEGAFVGLGVASALRLRFTYSVPAVDETDGGLFPVRYRLPASLRGAVRDQRVAVVNDVINAGSAVRGTLDDLAASGAHVVAVGSLMVLGSAAAALAAERGAALETLFVRPNSIWTPSECPLCARGLRLDDGPSETEREP